MSGARLTIFEAAWRGITSRVKELVTRENINDINEEGWTILLLACEGHHENLVEFLLSLGALVQISAPGLRTPLHVAYTPRLIKLLLGHGCNASFVDDHMNLPLHWAACAESVKLLINAYPAGIYAKNGNGQTPLDLCCAYARIGAANALLDAGSTPSSASIALHYALCNSNYELTDLLLDLWCTIGSGCI